MLPLLVAVLAMYWQCPRHLAQVTRRARAGHWLQASTLDTSHALTRHIATNENSHHQGTNRGTLALMNGFTAISSRHEFLVHLPHLYKTLNIRRDVRQEANKAMELLRLVHSNETVMLTVQILNGLNELFTVSQSSFMITTFCIH